MTSKQPLFWCDTRGMGPGLMHKLGYRATESEMESGDVAFWGIHPDPAKGFSIYLGVEHKTLTALLNDIKTGRVTNQLARMLKDYDRAYLMVEKSSHRIIDGYFAFPRRNKQSKSGWKWEKSKFRYASYLGWLTRIQEWGVKYVETTNLEMSARAIMEIFYWYNKDPEEHDVTIEYEPFQFNGRATLKRRVAAVLEGIGRDRSLEVSEHFPNIVDMINATEKEWLQVPGIGKVGAKKLFDNMREIVYEPRKDVEKERGKKAEKKAEKKAARNGVAKGKNTVGVR